MAASFFSSAIHVDFDSVLAMDEPGMVSMFQALVASGLQGFLGCSAVVYEEALAEFFANGRVRDGLVVSSVDGVSVEISAELFAETFELPVDGLGDLSEMPKDVVFDARSIVSLSGEPISLSGRKNQMKFEFRVLCDIVAKAISVKAGSFNAITVEKFSLMTALGESSEFPASKILSKKTVHRFVSINDQDGAEEVAGAAKKRSVSKKRPAADVEAAVPKKKRTTKKKSVSSISSLELVEVAEEAIPIQQVAEPSADDVDVIIQQVLDETRAADAPADIAQPAVTEEKHWFDLPYDDLVKQWEAERPVVTASDIDEDIATVDVAPADGDQQVQESVAQISADDLLSADERMSLDDILLTIPVDIPLPSSSMEITKITMGKSIKIPGVNKRTWFLKSLPRIPAEDKGKEVLVEKDPVKGNPAEEHYSLICADIELLVNLRAQVIDEVVKFLHSFSLKKLASINFEEMYKKEEQVLCWGETESPQIAIQRKFYILLKYRTVLVWNFLEAWRANFAPGQGSSSSRPPSPLHTRRRRRRSGRVAGIRSGRFDEENPFVQNSSVLLVQPDEGVSVLVVDRIGDYLPQSTEKSRVLVIPVGARHKCQQGSPRDRGAVIARTNSNTRSSCWIRTMILVDGMWTVEPCADRWVKIPLKVFVGVSGSVYEGALIEFFAREGHCGYDSEYGGQPEIGDYYGCFSEAFQLSIEGMVSFSELPAKSVAEMKALFTGTGVPFRPPNKSKDMKVEYRNDIVEKSLCVKAGSFNLVTSEKFDMMVAISAGLKVNWGHILFQTLVAMVYIPGKKSQGFAMHSVHVGEAGEDRPWGVYGAAYPQGFEPQCKLYEMELKKKVYEHRSNFDPVEPTANYDHMCIRFLDRELKEMIKQHRRAFYRKMDEAVANVNSSQTVLETNLVRQFSERQQQIASDLDFVKMQLAKLVNHFKERSDAKKEEAEISKKRRLL
ncbi:ABC transporter C family member 14 [Dorcoceras hygrometricum]|uniref:ABC transporter C family member 14 n=1 Tax=Dorcoceras hygrometricum TaxID=472368 RepID=A0A2Z7DEG7_9LAMI|nr:ABC transporter C family member 14 [Dorcoceras hygrometricum]